MVLISRPGIGPHLSGVSCWINFRKRMGRGRRMGDWWKIAELLYQHMFEDPTLLMTNGLCFRQTIPGIMKSGCVNTISTNSHCQVMIHIAVCLDQGLPIHPLPVCCGDDTLQHINHTVNLDVYEKYGCIIKEVSTTMEFMGRTFGPDGVKPNYLMKHLRKLKYVVDENLPSYLDAMARMYVHTDVYDFWETVSIALEVPLPLSRMAYLFWHDYSV